MRISGKIEGTLNVQRFFETLARVVGEQYNVQITVKSIRRKEPSAEGTDVAKCKENIC